MSEMVGRTIAGRFEIVRLIGQGGMGTVYESRHLTLPRKFAIKILRPDLAKNRTFVERFRREAIAASRIEHPNVIYITDFGQEDDVVYLVMEFLEGTGLDEVLSRNIRLPLTRSLPILVQLADALDYAHQVDVVHRDLKPENILLSEVRGRADVVKILDFGIAKMRSAEFAQDVLTMQGQVFGTAEYMSPEQATGEPTDGRSDIYALGCLSYEMITGSPPFVGSPMRILQAHVRESVKPPSTKLKDHPIPPAIDAIVLRCLAKDPDDRYRDAGELRRDVLRARGALFGMGADLARGKRSTGTHRAPDRQALTSGWQSLGGRVPELFAEGGASVPVGAASLAAQGGGVPPRRDEQLREQYESAVREVALALAQAAIASPEVSEALQRLLVVEEEAATLVGTIALAEQNFDRIRFDFGERTRVLRAAILDLSMSRAQLRGRAEIDERARIELAGQLTDLDFQVTELSRRSREIEAECAAQIHELDQDVKRLRRTRGERQEEAAELYHSLHQRIEALRPAATEISLRVAYEHLDGAVAVLDGSSPRRRR